MKSYKGFSVLLLSANMCLAEVTGVAFCELEHTESQQHTLTVLKGYYGVEHCEEVFAEASQRKGISFNGRYLRERGTPITDITPICAMRHWQHLSLMDMEIADFSCLATMPIKQMQLRNATPVDLKPISEIKTLEYLYIITTGIINYEAIGNASRLEYLKIAGRLTDTRPLATLTNLKTLQLNSNPIEDYSGLSKLTQLRQLELRSTDMNDADLEHLRPLTNLGNLDLHENNLTDISALAGLTDLWQLNISRNQIVDLSPLRNMNKLKYLDAKYNQIENIESISELPLLTKVDFYDNNIKDTSSFINLPSLVTFSAGGSNPLYDCAPKYKWDIDDGKLCTEEDFVRLSQKNASSGLWQRIKNVFN